MRELRALNGDAKTIARLAVDRMSVTFPARGTAPARLSLTPVRGYQGQADKVGRVLAGVPGVTVGRGLGAGYRAGGGGLPGRRACGQGSLGAAQPGMPAATALAAILTGAAGLAGGQRARCRAGRRYRVPA